jgi:hypothetical protein
MIIVHYDGNGMGMMAGVTEYIELFEAEFDFIGDYGTKEAAIEAHCAPGFELAGYYDTDVDTDFYRLPMDRILIARS